MKNRLSVYKMKRLIQAFVLIWCFITIPSQAIETVTYYHTDSLGSPVAGTDTSGALLWKEDYKPYGERIRKQVESDENTRWYTGHPEDKETGLTYAGARFYDSITGRFLAIDPVGFQEDNLQMFNRYTYANNNPYKYVDPDGEVPLLLIIPIAGGVINAIASGVNAYSNGGDVLSAAGKGFVGGFVGTGVGLGVAALTGNVPLAGAAGGLAGNLTEQGLTSLSTGQSIDPISAVTSTILGPIGGAAASKIAPTVGRLPSLTSSRNSKNFGPNSQRLVGQEGVSGSIGGATGVVQDKLRDPEN